MPREVSAQALVYQVLDEVLASTAVPANARRTMFSVVDGLRSNSAQAEEVRRAERVSVELHKLEWALRQGDSQSATTARSGLASLAVEMLNSRISAG
jgi:hypothetical protein